MLSDVSLTLSSLTRQSDCFFVVWLLMSENSIIYIFCDYVNNLARMESLCTFKAGFRSWMVNISSIKQSNLLRYLFYYFFLISSQTTKKHSNIATSDG